MKLPRMFFALIVVAFIGIFAMMFMTGDVTVHRVLHRRGHDNGKKSNSKERISSPFSSRNMAQISAPDKPFRVAATNTISVLRKPNRAQEPKVEAITSQPSTTAAQQKTAQPNNRTLTCPNCFTPNLANLTTIPEVCTGRTTTSASATSPEMLMLITTTLTEEGQLRRRAIRDTWASVTEKNTAKIRHVFLLGSDTEGRVSEDVLAESARYKDLLVSSFLDVYANLTYKTLAGLRYLVEHCAEAKYFLKTDHDMYVLPEKLLGLARNNHDTLQTSLGGVCRQSGKINRNPKSKFYVSVQSYPQSTHQGYCSGTGYIGSMNVARKIVQLSPNIPFFHLEDVYVALVLRSVNYQLTSYEGFGESRRVCWGGKKRAHKTMTIHQVSPLQMREMWDRKCGL